MSQNSPCPNKNICGSCTWSDISYEDQLGQKLSAINNEFKTAGFNIECTKITPSPKTGHYRNRMDFVINYQGKFGLREKGKWWKVIDNHKCFIADEPIEKSFDQIYGWIQKTKLSFYDRKSNEGLLRYAVIRSNKKGKTLVNIITGPPDENFSEQNIIKEITGLTKFDEITNLVWLVNYTKSDVSSGQVKKILKGDGFIIEEILDNKYKINPNSFFQTNSYSAEKLLETVLSFTKDFDRKKNFLDLYCGCGFFTLPLADRFKTVYGYEISADSIKDAVYNLSINKSAEKDNIKFKTAPAELLEWENYDFDYILVDPPRAGLHPKVIQEILKKGPEKIIYVSCNFAKFIAEFDILKDKYNIIDLTAVDMFPHTPHVELVLLLEKIK